ncbi:MAG: hypothetical protein JWO32_1402 [Bacteroidetes bacterium]|nr:hypothetical protein [Bacteroidota bacterium]
MNLTINKEDDFFDIHFSKQIENVNQHGELMLAYDGVLNTETISKLESEIESKILEKGLPKTIIKKVFFICVESLQNMFIHGHKDDLGAQHNFFILNITAKQVKVITANLISSSAIDKLKADIQKINSFNDPAELKTFYLEHLENNELSDKGGAGLGFITIAMKSGNKLKTSFEEINEKRSLFLMEVTINAE